MGFFTDMKLTDDFGEESGGVIPDNQDPEDGVSPVDGELLGELMREACEEGCEVPAFLNDEEKYEPPAFLKMGDEENGLDEECGAPSLEDMKEEVCVPVPVQPQKIDVCFEEPPVTKKKPSESKKTVHEDAKSVSDAPKKDGNDKKAFNPPHFPAEEPSDREARIKGTAIINAGCVVDGNMSAKNGAEIFGEVKGDVLSQGDICVHGDGSVRGSIVCDGEVTVSGVVGGDIKASEVTMTEGGLVSGKVTTNKGFYVSEAAVVIGDISSASLHIAGAVKGNIDVHGPVSLSRTAVVLGDINSATLAIESGASVTGFCSQCYGETDAKNFFKKEEWNGQNQ